MTSKSSYDQLASPGKRYRKLLLLLHIVPCKFVAALTLIFLYLVITSAHLQATQFATVASADGIEFKLGKESGRFGFSLEEKWLVHPHPKAGLLFNDEKLAVVGYECSKPPDCYVNLKTSSGVTAKLQLIRLTRNHAWLSLTAEKPGRLVIQVGGASPGFGLGDHASWKRFTTDVTGFSSDDLRSGQGFTRLISNFVIYPRQRFALVVLHPGSKVIRSTREEIAQGANDASQLPDIHFFFGSPAEIYKAFHQIKIERGYPVVLPDYVMFGVGWEAFGALGWRTNQKTVLAQIRKYLDLGFPLQWAVIGSGFWPRHDPRFHETTSFGMYDPELYPEPQAMIRQLHDWGLKVLHGLRITFIENGPFTPEGLRRGYFLSNDGKPILFHLSWPKSPCYLLDATNPDAVEWYVQLAMKWVKYGIDGFKEDLFGYGKYVLRDDKVDGVNWALKRKGLLIIQRNGYIASLGDLHRIEDFNYDQNQDRGPINALALAYSGFPLVYPDIVGGTFGENRFDTTVTGRMNLYIMRNARWAALHPSMSMGQPPWSFNDPRVEKILLAAAQLHDRLQPYFYSQAVRFAKDGFPWPMAPVPVVFPDDPNVYGRENNTVRGYQWMIGDALLAAPLYGDEYETSSSRDVYLPAGKWIHYDTGQVFEGPRLLKNFAIPVEHSGLFVGGTGVVVEKKTAGSRDLVARIYPVSSRARTWFWHRDGLTRSEFTIDVTDWTRIRVVDLTVDKEIEVRFNRFAYEFDLSPGHDYWITGGDRIP